MMNFLVYPVSDGFLPYCVLGLAAMVEGPVTLLIAGAAISIGQLLPLPVFLSVVVGNLTADMGWYGLGRFGKLEWLAWISPKAGIDPLDINKLEKSIHRYGPRLLFLSKLTVGLPIPTLISIGLGHVAMRRWVVLLVLGELIKSAVLVAVGYLFARGIQQAFSGVQMVLWGITLIVIASIFVFIRRNKKMKPTHSA